MHKLATTLRLAKGLLGAVFGGLRDAFEHPFGQLLFYSWLLTFLPWEYWPVLGIVVFSVAWHELGHLAAARANGYKVEVYSVGLPSKRTLNLGTIKGTRFQLTPWWFLGGYVSFEPTDAEVMKSPLWRRTSVILAGPLFNFLAAILLYAASFALTDREVYHHEALLSQVNPGIAKQAGLQPGDRILSVNGHRVTIAEDFISQLAGRQDEKVLLQIERNNQQQEIAFNAPLGQRIGVQLGWNEKIPVSLTESLGVGIEQTWLLLEKIGGTLYAAIFPSHHAEGSAAPAKFEVHSIFGFMQIASAYLKQGLNAFLAVGAALNVNLGFINLLPVPVLDGGHLVFMSIEKARGKALSVSLQHRLMSIFIWVLLGLALLGLYNDLVHPLR